MAAVNSMRMAAPWSSVQTTCSGFRISTSELASMSEAFTCPGPSFFSTMRLTPSECSLSAISLMLRTMLVTSSRTPGIEENSCSTPSICTVVMAAPCSEESSTRRSALPSVMPKPRSSGSATTVANLVLARPGTISSLLGLIKSCQFFCKTFATGSLMLCVYRELRALLDTPRSRCRTACRGSSHPPALARPASIVRDRRHIADRGDLKADRLQRPQRRLAARARPHHLDVEHLHAVLHRLLAGVLGRHLGRIRGRLARALEAHGPGRRPGNGIALRVGNGDHGIVEGGADVRHAGGDVLAL